MYTIYMKKTIFAAIFIVFALTVLTPKASLAGKGLPFGGRIGFLLPCANGLMIVVITADPKSVGPYIITPAVIPHANFAPFIGHAILGTYIPGIPCYIPPFIVIPTKGAVTEFGTSLVPAVI
jgi:hypothetical protein